MLINLSYFGFYNDTDKVSNKFELNPGLYTFVNPYSYTISRKFIDINMFRKVYVDGFLAVMVFKLLGFECDRLSFDMTSVAPKVFLWCIQNNKSIAFIGSKEEDILKAVQIIKKDFPMLNICIFHHGYLKDKKIKISLIKEIVEKYNPDVVVAGMGAPLQEDFLVELKRSGWHGLGFTCGGFIHQTATSGLDYYPAFFDRYNLRWLYRMYDEPKLIKRYILEYPKFFLYILYDYYKYKQKQKKEL